MINRVALFLAHLRSKSNLTYSNLNFMVKHTSSLIGDIVSNIESKTMSVFRSFGLNQSPAVEELGLEFLELAEPFNELDTDYKQMQYFAKSGNFIQPVEEIFPGGTSIVQQRASATGTVRQLDAVLRPIVEEIRCLERDGITVDTPNFQGVVKFTVVQVVGDNLGLNAMLGYTESFSGNCLSFLQST